MGGYMTDPQSGDKSLSRLCSLVVALGALGLAFFLAIKGHAGEAVTIIIADLTATWGSYTANSTARVITAQKEPPPPPQEAVKAE